MNYAKLQNPSISLPGTDSYALTKLAERILWRQLFGNTPTLRELLGNTTTELLHLFLSFCEDKDISIDWTMHLRFLYWLQHEQTRFSSAKDDCVMECLAASAAAWVNSLCNAESHRMVLICSETRLGMGAERARAINTVPKVSRIKINSVGCLETRFQYSVSSNINCWSCEEWLPIEV